LFHVNTPLRPVVAALQVEGKKNEKTGASQYGNTPAFPEFIEKKM
jgi:hypothetical protein